MNKPEMKLEGDKLKLQLAQSVAVDTDKDGEAAIKGSITAELEVDGSEVLSELMKSSTLAQKAKEMLQKIGLVKGE